MSSWGYRKYWRVRIGKGLDNKEHLIMKCRLVIPGFADRPLSYKERKSCTLRKYGPENPGKDEILRLVGTAVNTDSVDIVYPSAYITLCYNNKQLPNLRGLREIFISPLCYMSIMGQLQLCFMFSSVWSPGQQRTTLGRKSPLHILLDKANPMPSLTSVGSVPSFRKGTRKREDKYFEE